MTKSLAVVGASGHAKVAADAAIASGWRKIVFFDDRWPELDHVGRWAVDGNTAELARIIGHFDSAIVGLEDNRSRLAKLAELEEQGAALGVIVHPQAVVSRFAEMGLGSLVFAGAVVNVDARLGRGVIVNNGATVYHDCVLGDGVHVSPGAHLAGEVTVGACSWIGIGASVKQGVTIGRDVMVAAGAIVISDIPDNTTVMGVPARAAS